MEVNVPELKQMTSTIEGTSSSPLVNVSTTPNSSRIAKRNIATPSCAKSRSVFEMSVNELSLLTQDYLVKIVKRKTIATQIAVELTRGPFKRELEENRKTAAEKLTEIVISS